MRKILFLLLIIPTLVFSQKKDYTSYDKAVSYFNKGEIEKAKSEKGDPDIVYELKSDLMDLEKELAEAKKQHKD